MKKQRASAEYRRKRSAVINGPRLGSIVLKRNCHLGRKVKALPRIINELRARGLEPGTMTEVLSPRESPASGT